MSLDDISLRIQEYYKKLKNPKLYSKEWVIIDEKLYLKYKNKLTITAICFINNYDKENIAVIETKKEYIAVKYNENFVCLRISDTEYGLVTGEYELLAINKKIIADKYETSSEKIPTLKGLCESFDWKLSKNAKQYLDFNK